MKFSLKIKYLMGPCLDCHQTCKDLPEGRFQEFTIFFVILIVISTSKANLQMLNFHLK